MLLATTALGSIAYRAMNPPPPPPPEPEKPVVKVIRRVPIRPLPKQAEPPKPAERDLNTKIAGCLAEAREVFQRTPTSKELDGYMTKHPRCLDAPVPVGINYPGTFAFPDWNVEFSNTDPAQRETRLQQQINFCEVVSRQETLTPPGGTITVLGNSPTVVAPKSRADSCWKYVDQMRRTSSQQP
jgi:hypothetical protein